MAATAHTAREAMRAESWFAFVSRLRRVGGNYLVRRIAKAVFTIFFVTSLTFFIIRLLPGSPIDVFIAQQMGEYGLSYEQAASQATALYAINPDEPLIAQYVSYLGNLARGNLGTSLVSPGTPVLAIILQYLPWTLASVGLALLISFTLGIGLGMLMAYRRESWLDHVLSALGSLFHSIPNYLLAIMIVVFFGIWLEWLPITKMRGSFSPGVTPDLSLDFLLDALFHAALPITVYVLTTIGTWMLLMRSSTLAALEEDYVTVAKARGLKEGRIITAYVGRNAILPLFTQLAIAIGFVVGGSILVERIFQYQGIGLILANVINQRDYPVMQGVFLILTFSVVGANLVADLLYGQLDPRIRVGATTEQTMVQLMTDQAEVAGPSARRVVGAGGVGVLRIMLRNKAGFAGFLVVVLIVLISFIGPFFTPEATTDVTKIYQAPSWQHWLGTDYQGRDVTIQLVDGGRSVLLVGLLAAVLATLISVAFGALSAYAGGAVDSLITGLADIVLTIPQLPLLVVLAAFISFKSEWQLALIIGLLAWPSLLRAVRAQVLSLREREYVEAAQALDLGTAHILFREILPNMLSYIAISFTIGMTGAIYAQAALYLLGLAPLAGDNWGIMLNFAYARGAIYFKNSFWYIMAPILAISILQLAMVTMTRSLEDVFNPRLRAGG